MTTSKSPVPIPEIGSLILIKAKTLPLWIEQPVTDLSDEHISTGSGMGLRIVKICDYGISWKLKNDNNAPMPCPWCGPITIEWNRVGYYYLAHQHNCHLYPSRHDLFVSHSVVSLMSQWNAR